MDSHVTPEQKSDSTSFIFFLALFLAVVVLVGGAVLAMKNQGFVLLGAGVVAVIAVLVVWPISKAMIAEAHAARLRQEESLKLFTDRFEQISILLNLISEQQLLSDRAKSVAFRAKDREALRGAIAEEIRNADYEAAYALADDFERAFGSNQEAARFRDEIAAGRNTAIQKQVNEAVSRIDGLARGEQWPAAMAEVEKLQARFPDDERVKNLPAEVEALKQQHKKALLDSWNDAVARHDVDGSIAILRKLDIYLSTAEAESLQESVRGVFKEKINQLRTQFSLAVQDHHWGEAIRIGETIVRDFPNSKLAQEVAQSMQGLRARAAEPAVA